MTAWPTAGWARSWRQSGKPFYCQDADTAAGFYFFAAPADALPRGPYTSARMALQAQGDRYELH